jgi:hypothetical protein
VPAGFACRRGTPLRPEWRTRCARSRTVERCSDAGSRR